MVRTVGPQAGFGGALRDALIHLRLAFSIVLTPLFIWGVYLAASDGHAVSWWPMVWGYLIVHGPLYGGMNAFNSYYDRDDGPIGALEQPPPVNRTVLVVALICKFLALLAGFLLNIRFGILVAVGIVLSVAYSHPRWRWKEQPFLAALVIFVMQGVCGTLWGYTAATQQGFWPEGWQGTLGLLGAATWTLGFYPLTGVYQIATDGPRGVRTLAVTLGVKGCFVFGAAVMPLGGMGVCAALLGQGALWAALVSVLYCGVVAVRLWRWYGRFAQLTPRENQRILMNVAYTNGLAFSVLFSLLLWGTL